MSYNKNKIRKKFLPRWGFSRGRIAGLPLEASTGSAWRSIYYGKQFLPFTAEIAVFFLILLIFPFAAFAMENSVKLTGSLDIKQIQKCENNYDKICAVPDAKTVGEELSKKWSCMKEKMKVDKSCKQAYLIRDITGYSPTELRSYPRGIVVFTITSLADDQISFYIVDKDGKLFGLANDNYQQINTNQTYNQLKKSYPNLSFTNFIFWSVPSENQFPKTSFDGSNLQLIFKQELRDGACIACKPVAIAYVAYIFNARGKFSGIKILKIETLSHS